MKNEKKFSIKEAKKQIAEATKGLESRLMKARNQFEIYRVLEDGKNIINAEIQSWVNELYDENGVMFTNTSFEPTEALTQIEDLKGLVEKFEREQLIYLPNALAIQQAMINSHQLKEKVIFE
jgi:hypothetical protein